MKTVLVALVALACVGVCIGQQPCTGMSGFGNNRFPPAIAGRFALSGEYVIDTITGAVYDLKEWREKRPTGITVSFYSP